MLQLLLIESLQAVQQYNLHTHSHHARRSQHDYWADSQITSASPLFRRFFAVIGVQITSAPHSYFRLSTISHIPQPDSRHQMDNQYFYDHASACSTAGKGRRITSGRSCLLFLVHDPNACIVKQVRATSQSSSIERADNCYFCSTPYPICWTTRW